MPFETILSIRSSERTITPGGLHKTTMELFPHNLPDGNPRQAAGILFRREDRHVLVRSVIPPCKPARLARIESLNPVQLPTLRGTVRLSVRLACEENTDRAPGFLPENSRTARDTLPIPRNRRKTWALEKMSRNGFLFLEQPVATMGEEPFGDGRPPIPWIELHGEALVVDNTRALMAWEQGVGRGKSYGYGLIVIGV
ncbi:type I-E CRISPR-associated protein Cas6/Cse3/CasE [Arthrobacter horti]|uniref:type I-E CRISPR-associated protein Cas6/Cse3/CasE n=1 Tax=Arthrobacter TaxID=1663 RepID=UPI003460C809